MGTALYDFDNKTPTPTPAQNAAETRNHAGTPPFESSAPRADAARPRSLLPPNESILINLDFNGPRSESENTKSDGRCSGSKDIGLLFSSSSSSAGGCRRTVSTPTSTLFGVRWRGREAVTVNRRSSLLPRRARTVLATSVARSPSHCASQRALSHLRRRFRFSSMIDSSGLRVSDPESGLESPITRPTARSTSRQRRKRSAASSRREESASGV